MIQIENLNINNKQQLINYFQKCQEDRTILRDGLRNPDNEQIAWYKNEVQNDDGIPALAKKNHLNEEMIEELKKLTKNNENVSAKFCCWIHFQLKDLAKKDFVVMRELNKHAEDMIEVLEKFGYKFVSVAPELTNELTTLAQEQKAIGFSVCRNAWMKEPDPLQEIQRRPEGLNTIFCEIKGTNCIANYAEDLFKLRRSLSDCIVINGKIPNPTVDEGRQEVKGIVKPVLQRFLREKRITGNDAKVLKALCCRYFSQVSKEKVGTLLYYGSITEKKEIQLLDFAKELPIDVIILNHAKEESYDFKGDFMVIEEEFASPLAQFPEEVLATGAASVEKTLDQVLYGDENFSRPNQYSDVESIILNVTKEDVTGLWSEEIKMRTGYGIENGKVIVPTLYAQITGLGNFSKRSYIDFVSDLTQNSMCFVTEALEISPIKLKGDSSLKTMSDKHFNKKFAEKVLSMTPLSILSQEKQNLLVEKANEMIKKYKFNSIWDVLTFAGILFAIPEALAQLIHVWDLTKVNPKIVMVLTGTRKLESKEEVMLQYLHAIGFDVLLFVPTGYGLVTEDLLRSGLQKIDLSNYNFSIQYSEIVSNRKGLLNRLFHRLAK
ncbi:YceG family protein [Anaerobutyricum soehngenii]|uniref:YceG family protein n=1 Tax=Anaerobutyricum soehngenii TaxID=105843 RepID=UPI0032C07D55